jgi:hypothetical protein
VPERVDERPGDVLGAHFANKSLENDQFDRADAHIAAVALRTAGRSDREPFSETGSTRPVEQRFSTSHGL